MNKVRKDFESWAKEHFPSEYYSLATIGGQYAYASTRIVYKAYKAAHDAQQAIIDRLMLEYCPDEMTEEQMEEYARHQKRAPE